MPLVEGSQAQDLGVQSLGALPRVFEIPPAEPIPPTTPSGSSVPDTAYRPHSRVAEFTCSAHSRAGSPCQCTLPARSGKRECRIWARVGA
eukprot:2491866-Rhodomonas_salina.1